MKKTKIEFTQNELLALNSLICKSIDNELWNDVTDEKDFQKSHNPDVIIIKTVSEKILDALDKFN